MLQRSFASQCPEQAALSRCQLIMDDDNSQVSGIYEVIDCYCQDPACDCQKVTLAIVDQRSTIYATIAYGWQSVAYYCKWGLDRQTAQALTQGFLDPSCLQSKHAELFLEAFQSMLRDAAFIDRLKSHYNLFKKSLSTRRQLN